MRDLSRRRGKIRGEDKFAAVESYTILLGVFRGGGLFIGLEKLGRVDICTLRLPCSSKIKHNTNDIGSTNGPI